LSDLTIENGEKQPFSVHPPERKRDMRNMLTLAGLGIVAAVSASAADARRVVIANCPPGLATKTPACIPPGRVSRQFVVGRRVPTNIEFVSFNSIPLVVRQRFDLSSRDRFFQRGDTLVIVNPRTRVVRRTVLVRF
jgi:hypothetical protein